MQVLRSKSSELPSQLRQCWERHIFRIVPHKPTLRHSKRRAFLEHVLRWATPLGRPASGGGIKPVTNHMRIARNECRAPLDYLPVARHLTKKAEPIDDGFQQVVAESDGRKHIIGELQFDHV
jgi:hypothetical protein